MIPETSEERTSDCLPGSQKEPRQNCSRGFNKLFSRIPSTTLFGAVNGSGIPHRGWRLHLLAANRLLNRSADNHSAAFLLQCPCIHRRHRRTHASVSWQK